jgi:hypothetical protein
MYSSRVTQPASPLLPEITPLQHSGIFELLGARDALDQMRVAILQGIKSFSARSMRRRNHCYVLANIFLGCLGRSNWRIPTKRTLSANSAALRERCDNPSIPTTHLTQARAPLRTRESRISFATSVSLSLKPRIAGVFGSAALAHSPVP